MRTRPRQRRLAVVGTALLTALTATASLPSAAADRSERHHGGGLSATIRYTEYGIPHIVAEDYADLGFGTGWAQAADQVCTLADGFLTVRGDRSRYFGADAAPDGSLSSATKNLSSDLYFRGVRESRTVEKLLAMPAPAGASKDVKDSMRGWAAGYNAWLKQNRITDPACKGADWVKPVTELDVAARGFAISVLGGQGRGIDGITAAQPPTTSGTPAPAAADKKDIASAARELFSQDDSDMGSNAVAFSGATTANGRGLLLGNPHYPWQGGRRFWQSQQTIPGELNVMGGSLLGTTGISIGHNAHVAWSHTVATGVTLNLHQLTLDPSDPTAYVVDGKREQMTKRTVTVAVKGGADVTRTQWWTRYGPVVTSLGAQLPLPWTATTAYALNDPNAVNMRASDTALGFSKARSTDDVLKALRRTQGIPWVNTIAADSSGHSLFTQSQVLPRITDDLAARCSTALGKVTYPSSGVAVLDGSRGDCALGSDKDAVQPGIFGPSKMPVLKDAPYAENSNDSAWLANVDQPLTGYERVFGTVGTQRSMRTRGAVEDVAAMADKGRLTVADLQRQQFADRVPAGDLTAADTAKACAALPGGTATGSDGKAVDVSAACGVLKDWDRTMSTGSRGALLFDRFWRKLSAAVPAAQLWKVPFSAADPVRTPNTLNTKAPGFATALADTVAELRGAGIALDAKLGDHQTVTRGGERIPVHGGTESLGVWNKVEPNWDAQGGGYTEVVHGSSYIQAVGWDGGSCPVARTMLTYSQSSNPNSAHYSDQTHLFSRKKWVSERFCEKDILKSPALKVVRVRG
ncbi:acylase [Streptomyces sp. SID8379]|uniref:penicillin acylase family protein n=1 Tax=unclassified Streptomyces TaxID=2593676 RepID=UPI00035F74F9|nr:MULTISPECIES: penicillin acylase family protein [unclassified Streptomyces]MYW66934.1 acylase [Streptomyces sp. SID8379]